MRAGTPRCAVNWPLVVESRLEVWRIHSGCLMLRSTAAARSGGRPRASLFADPVSWDRMIIGLVVQSLIASMRILIPV
jgi:hypothetical protein